MCALVSACVRTCVCVVCFLEGKGTTEALVSVPLQTVTKGGMRGQDTLCPQPHPSPLGMKGEAERSGWEERGRLGGTRGGWGEGEGGHSRQKLFISFLFRDWREGVARMINLFTFFRRATFNCGKLPFPGGGAECLRSVLRAEAD